MFHLSPRKLHLQEAAECDMKPNEGEVALKRYIYIFPDVGLLWSTYPTTREVCSEGIYFRIKTRALLLYRATVVQVVEEGSYLRHPLQDDGVNETTAGPQVSSGNYKSTFIEFLFFFYSKPFNRAIHRIK